MLINYQKISSQLLQDLPERTRSILTRRFGLEGGEIETLESVGKDFSITRERVRQIQDAGLSRLRQESKNYKKAINYFYEYLKERGNLKEENRFLTDLGKDSLKNHVFFLLNLGDDFERFSETADLHSLWTIDESSLGLAKETGEAIEKEIKNIGSPLSFEDIFEIYQKQVKDSDRNPIDKKPLLSYIEVSKRIEQGPQGAFGLKEWGEINPRGVRDKAYIALKEAGSPLHFREVAAKINGLNFEKGKEALPQTVHNELIKDRRFVLVGRGLYALQGWGYNPGVVKDVIFRLLKEKGPLGEKEIVDQVLQRRFVKRSTVLVNLKKYFSKGENEKYRV